MHPFCGCPTARAEGVWKMAEAQRCPSLKSLARFANGEVDEIEASALRVHIDNCVKCSEMLEKMREVAAEESRRSRSPASDLAENQAPPSDSQVTKVLDKFLSPPQSAEELGRLGSQFRVLQLIGEGGMGIVFLAEDLTLERKVALKVMKPSESMDDVSRQRFLQEGKVAAKLEHDHIITIYQVGVENDLPYMAMQLLEGESLEVRLKRERLEVMEILRIGKEVSAGLAHAHACGMIHRDIKPANIWLEKGTGRVKILDFGLARPIDRNSRGLTRTGMVVGTPEYMAPEQARGQELDHRCDIFSLGCVLYHMCTGRKPFQGEDVLSTLLALAQEEPIPIRKLNPDIPWDLEDRIRGMMAKHPGDRPKSVNVVIDELNYIEKRLKNPEPVGDSLESQDSSVIIYDPSSRRRNRPPTPPSGVRSLPPKSDDPQKPKPKSPHTEELEKVGLKRSESVVLERAKPRVRPRSSAHVSKEPEPTTPVAAAESPTPPERPKVPFEEGRCPRCGSKRFGSAGQGWCLACGFTPDDVKYSGGDIHWGWGLATGVLLLVTGMIYLSMSIAPSSSQWHYWVWSQLAVGIVGMIASCIWIYCLILPYDERGTQPPLWLSPSRFLPLSYRLCALVQTRIAVCLLAWSVTLLLGAIAILRHPGALYQGQSEKQKSQAAVVRPSYLASDERN
ncbi:MAG: hypothetical protein KatS3mg105_3416 [Gemmatales bacterium]|nr:MAG: hypothetical protein KatS3mg105_3416 [Gemmatales bacterium]